MPRPNVILTGFMATGKTTVGKLLAKQLGYAFIDTDNLIEKRSQLSIPDIFRSMGEEAFRRMESDIARELSQKEGYVIATGGRLMLDEDNAAALGRTGRIFCLAATAEEIMQRISKDSKVARPLLDTADPMGRIKALMQEREDGYKRFPQVTTSKKTPEEIVRQILSHPGFEQAAGK